MRNKKADEMQMAVKRREFLDKGYELFCAKNIDTVSLQDIADASGYGIATLYRYFSNKANLVVEVATVKWAEFKEAYQQSRTQQDQSEMTAAEIYSFFLDSFIELYLKGRDLLRFNQFFNVYVQAEKIDTETLRPYQKMIGTLRESFHKLYLKAMKDHTFREDVSEEEIFSTTLHLMLAAVTRYAVGLVYIPEKGFDPIEEIQTLKEMLLARYTIT